MSFENSGGKQHPDPGNIILVDGSFIAILQQGAEKWGNEAGLCPGPEGGGSLGKPRWHPISRCAYKDSSHRTFSMEVQPYRLMQPQTMAGHSGTEDWREEFVNMQSCRWGFPGDSVV